MDRVKFGQYIAVLRKEKGLTQKDLAEQLHVSVPAISKWERGLNYPDIISLQPLAEILGVSLAELFNQSPGKEDPGVREYLEDLLSIAVSNSLRERNIQKRKNITIAVFTIILVLLSVLKLVILATDREPVFKVVATACEESGGEGLKEFKIYVTTEGKADQEDFRKHMAGIEEKWKAGVYANDDTDVIHILYYKSADTIKMDKDNYFYESYIFK